MTHKPGQIIRYTAEEESAIVAQYASGEKWINELRIEYRIDADRLKRMIEAHGVAIRPAGFQETTHSRLHDKRSKVKRKQTPKAKGTEAGSPAQLNNGYEFSTDKTRKPPTRRIVADVPCGWDGVTRNVIRVARGERTCMLCGEAVTGRECPTSGCDGGELVDTVTALGLRDGEWVRE